MGRITQYILLVLIAATLASCGSKKFIVNGQIDGASSLGVYFDNINFINNESMVMEKGETDGSGNFKIVLEENPGKGYYRLRLGAKSAYVVLNGSEQSVKINGALSEFNSFGYQVEGAPLASEFVSKMNAYSTRTMGINEVQEYVKTEADPAVALPMAIMLFGGSVEFAPLHTELSQRIKDAMPEEPMADQYLAMTDAMNQELMRRQSLEKVKLGEIAPDIELPGPDGKTRKLSDLRGKIVLLDFWASWCGPCRRDNPKVVKTYDKYKDKGFTVFSVSLDGLDDRTKQRFAASGQVEEQMQRSKERWIAAIEKDNLKWDSHVSDLKKWSSKGAALYGVRSIPQTYLIDREGRIAAINPRYNLEEAIQKVI